MEGEGKKIEQESFSQIEKRLSHIPMPERDVVKRVVHTTADFSFARRITFHHNAVQEAVKAIREGCDVITDVKMVACGINTSRLEKYGGEVRCFISSPEVVAYAEKHKITRARASVRMHRREIEGSIFVVGNAPTALFELLEQIEAGVRPRFVIAACVGFVGAAEAKERVLSYDLPAIVVRGRRGGSNIAAAIINALILLADEDTTNHS
ncbi:precorrin-8X methylmutase [Candidatus Pyrohabitans sp.]